MARTSCFQATHAVIGRFDGMSGILHWHDNELSAWRDAKIVRQFGGTCRVIPAPEGDLSDEHRREVNDLMADFF